MKDKKAAEELGNDFRHLCIKHNLGAGVLLTFGSSMADVGILSSVTDKEMIIELIGLALTQMQIVPDEETDMGLLVKTDGKNEMKAHDMPSSKKGMN